MIVSLDEYKYDTTMDRISELIQQYSIKNPNTEAKLCMVLLAQRRYGVDHDQTTLDNLIDREVQDSLLEDERVINIIDKIITEGLIR